MPKIPTSALCALCLIFIAPGRALEFHGRAVDRGTLDEAGRAKGVAGVQVSVYDGKRLLASSMTNKTGQYRFKKISAPKVRVVYKAKEYLPAPLVRFYALEGDTGSRDVYFDKTRIQGGVPLLGGSAPRDEKEGKGDKDGKGDEDRMGFYYRGLARGLLSSATRPSFFREGGDSVFTLSGAFEAGDSSAEFRGVMCELLWAEFLAEDRPVEARVYMAHALKPLLDSLQWGRVQEMERYLEPDPEGLELVSARMHEALRNPRKLPAPKDVRKARVPQALAGAIAARYMEVTGLKGRPKARFLAAWKKTWPKDPGEWEWHKAPEAKDGFRAREALEKIIEARPDCAAARYMRSKALFAAGDYSHAADEAGQANKLRSGYPAARYLEARAYLQLGRDQEALGRFGALKEALDPAWKARGYYGVAMIEEKEQRHSEAAADLWKSVRLVPDPETIDLLAGVSLKMNDHSEAEKLLRDELAKGGAAARVHYWLGRYAESDSQVGVAEDHYRKAWDAAPAPDFAEALARLYVAREEYALALAMLEPMKGRLSEEARQEYAECLLQTGRSADAMKEYAAVYAADKSPAVLGRYTEALLQAGRVDEALKTVAGFPDPLNPVARFALAKASLANQEPAKARVILEELAKREDGNPEYHFHLGYAHFLERNYAKAKNEFDAALRYRTDYLEALYYSGMSLVKTGRSDAARNYFNELTQRTAAEWRAKGYLGLGYSFASQQKPDAAENYFEKSLASKETAEAEGALALSRRRLGGPEHWEAQAKKAYALDPRQPKAALAMGDLLVFQGKKIQALRLVQKALESNPNSCELLAGIAKCQYLMGQYQAGRSTSAAAISMCPEEPEGYFYAAVTSDKLQNRKEAEDYFKAYRKAGGDEDLLPQDYR
jgi:predicted Zn-dependent protease